MSGLGFVYAMELEEECSRLRHDLNRALDALQRLVYEPSLENAKAAEAVLADHDREAQT